SSRRFSLRSGSPGEGSEGGSQGMISSGVVVYVSCQPVDFRKGAASLMAVVRDGGLDPFNGALYVFRSKRADRVRIVWWDGSGVCLYSKTLEDRGFCWPGLSVARIRLDHSQLMALLAGMDWKKIRPNRTRRPLLTG
ncbi:IS66 family insertion sequence element accessory protein TnpB, partial [Brucella sp. NBRC 113783]